VSVAGGVIEPVGLKMSAYPAVGVAEGDRDFVANGTALR